MSFATQDELPPAQQMPGALAELAEARLRLDAARRLAAHRKAGHSDVVTCEWQLEQALRRIDRLRSRIDWQGSPNDAA